MDSGAAACSSSRNNRAFVERERRMSLRNLYSQLSSLLPPQPRKMSTHKVLEQATVYVNQMRKRVEELKEMKLQVEEECREMRSGPSIISSVINITDLESTLEVNLITGLDGKFKLCDIIKILVEEGAEVVSAAANHSAGDRIIYSIHCRVYFSRPHKNNFQEELYIGETLFNLINLFFRVHGLSVLELASPLQECRRD
ncbi:hypothetical protein CRYUN_Cryun04dG0141600 [Craigia yunnanensis]